jgi:HSP20 family protein
MAEEQKNGPTAVAERRPMGMSLFGQMERELEDMRRRMATMFRWPFVPLAPTRLTTEMMWAPTVDMYEKDGALIIKAELPGVKKNDVSVTFDDGVLTIQGKREEEKEVKDAKYYARERFSGSFSRSFALPEGVDKDKIAAEFKDGVLEVRVPLPARAPAEPARIPIRS